MKKIEITMKATIGQVKKRIAEVFSIPFNSFKIFTQNKMFGPNDYDSIFKTFGYLDRLLAQKIPVQTETPKMYLAQSQSCINVLFALLSKENTSYVDSVWNLLTNIPASKKMQEEIKEMKFSEGVIFIVINSKDGIL